MPNNENVYIRPRRGTRTTMTETEKAALILKEGELFFEFPDEGVGKAPAKVKIGDGVSAYSQLDYVLGNEAFFQEIDFVEERSDYPQTLIDEIVSGVTLSKFTANAKRVMQLLLNKFGEYLPLIGGTIDGNLIVNGDVKSESATLKSEASGSTKFVASNVQNDDVEVIVPDHAGTLALVSDFPISDNYDATSGSAMSGKAVNKALQTLDVTGDSNIAASKTIKSWSETDGKVSITTQNISITKSQVSDFPTIGNGTLTIQKNGSNVATFTANQTGNATANIGVPTALSDLSQNANYRTVTDTEKSTWNGKASTAVATQSANGLMSSGDKKKLDGIANYAEVNQNAYSTIGFTAGSAQVSYNASTSTDTFTFDAGTAITFSGVADKKVSIGVDTNNSTKFEFYDDIISHDSYYGAVFCHLPANMDDYNGHPMYTNLVGINPYRGRIACKWVDSMVGGYISYSDIGFNSGGSITNTWPQNLEIKASDELYSLRFGVFEEYWEGQSTLGKAWALVPYNGTSSSQNSQIRLGSPSYKWKTIYAIDGSINTSDRNLKKDINSIENIKDFFMDLKPVSYKFKDGKRTHYGLIAQDVKESMDKFGMDNLDFAGYCEDHATKVETETIIHKDPITGQEQKEEVKHEVPIKDEYIYGLRYDEFIAPLIQMVQQQQREIDELKKKIDKLSK